MMFVTLAAAIFSSASAFGATLECPSGSVKVVECSTETFKAAYCETAHSGSAMVVSNAPGFVMAQVGPRIGHLHSKTAMLKSKIVIALQHTDASGPGLIVMANEKRNAYCEVRKGYVSVDQTPMP